MNSDNKSEQLKLIDNGGDEEEMYNIGKLEAEYYDNGIIPSNYWRKRVVLSFLCFFGIMIDYLLRTNLSIAIIPMSIEFQYSNTQRGLILSSFFIGYVFTQIPGGILSQRIGGKFVLGLGVVWPALITLIFPPMASLSIIWVIAGRILMGLGEGVTYPAMNQLIAQWLPTHERSLASAFTFSSGAAGNVIALSLAPVMISTMGWESVFYLFALPAFIWAIAFQVLAFSTPEEDPQISKAELAYIRAHIQKTSVAQSQEAVPWRLLFTNSSVLSVITVHVFFNWLFYTMLTFLPTYLNEELDFDLDSSGFLSVLPFLLHAGIGIAAGRISDHLISTGRLSVIASRRLFVSIGFIVPGICLLLITVTTSTPFILLFLNLAVGFAGATIASYPANIQDLGGSRYTGIVFGVSNTMASLPGVLSPILTGLLLDSGAGWSAVFILAAALGLFANFVFVWFVSIKPIIK